MSLAPVPTVAELLEHPERVRDLPPAVAADLLVRLTALTTALATLALPAPANGHESEADRLLDVKEAAERLGVSPDYLYRRAGRFPLTVRLGRTLRFSARSLERYIRTRQGR